MSKTLVGTTLLDWTFRMSLTDKISVSGLWIGPVYPRSHALVKIVVVWAYRRRGATRSRRQGTAAPDGESLDSRPVISCVCMCVLVLTVGLRLQLGDSRKKGDADPHGYEDHGQAAEYGQRCRCRHV